jgi:hypothetical protein
MAVAVRSTTSPVRCAVGGKGDVEAHGRQRPHLVPHLPPGALALGDHPDGAGAVGGDVAEAVHGGHGTVRGGPAHLRLRARRAVRVHRHGPVSQRGARVEGAGRDVDPHLRHGRPPDLHRDAQHRWILRIPGHPRRRKGSHHHLVRAHLEAGHPPLLHAHAARGRREAEPDLHRLPHRIPGSDGEVGARTHRHPQLGRLRLQADDLPGLLLRGEGEGDDEGDGCRGVAWQAQGRAGRGGVAHAQTYRSAPARDPSPLRGGGAAAQHGGMDMDRIVPLPAAPDPA